MLDSHIDIHFILDPNVWVTYAAGDVDKAGRGMTDLHKVVTEMLKERGTRVTPK